MQYYDVNKLARELEDIVSVMSDHFSSKPGTYYSDALFFLSLGLHRFAPINQNYAVMFDADTKFRRDVKELFQEFDKFPESAVFGLAPELTPVYRHVLYLYRNKNPGTKFGEPVMSGGYPGYNSGVVLFNLDRLRKSLEYDQIISRDSVRSMTEKYLFKVSFVLFEVGVATWRVLYKTKCGATYWILLERWYFQVYCFFFFGFRAIWGTRIFILCWGWSDLSIFI